MSWVHAICENCYALAEPDLIPFRVTDDWQPSCCWCQGPTNGIYYRYDPKLAPCGGDHAWDD